MAEFNAICAEISNPDFSKEIDGKAIQLREGLATVATRVSHSQFAEIYEVGQNVPRYVDSPDRL